MRWQLVLPLLLGLTCRVCQSTCVFESDFGFTLNCAFKKSGLFRVRNLGGVKGYVGLGFSVGDELGFRQSLSTLESNRRRSTDSQAAPNTVDTQEVGKRSDVSAEGRAHSGRIKGFSRGVPPFRPLPPPAIGTLAQRAAAAIHSMPAPVLAPQPQPPQAHTTVVVVPAFQALPASIVRAANAAVPRPPAPVIFQNALQMANRRFQVVVPDMPSPNTLSNNIVPPSKAIPDNTLAVRTLPAPVQSKPVVVATTNPMDMDIHAPNPMLMGHSISSLAQASNISVETLAAAIKLKEEQLRASTTTTTTTTTTTLPPVTKPSTVKPRYSLAGHSKVMNAPKEYYPVGYDKNYDDNFTSKVELPDTSFSCGDQKHFPGLYADEDLGCMVFHVCAFTDDGLVMKSFLCPESTLFDQTILKCNWWFYVDCKSSRKLYDSNIPISKSYQLMKALAFFSSYRNQSANAT